MKIIKDIWQFELDGSLVCHNNYNNMADKPELKEFIKSDEIKSLIQSIPEDVILALGWDGTMLDVIRAYHDDGRPFLWINFWSRGFLLNHQEWISNNQDFISRNYPLLEVRQNNEIKGFWFNDINIYSPEGKVLDLSISRDGMWSVNLKWDGVVIATPAGSTGHAMSGWWPAIPHDTNITTIVPKLNMKPMSSKIISPNKKPLIVENWWRKFTLNVNIDGNTEFQSETGASMRLEIQQIPDKVRLLISKSHEQDWDNKVMQAQWFN